MAPKKSDIFNAALKSSVPLYSALPTMTREEPDFCTKWKIARPLRPYDSYDEVGKKCSDFDFAISPDFEMPYRIHVQKRPTDLHSLMYDLLYPEWMYRHTEMPSRSLTRSLESTHYYDGVGTMHCFVHEQFAEDGKLNIQIDLNYSKNRLVKDFKFLVDEMKNLYGEAHRGILYREFFVVLSSTA